MRNRTVKNLIIALFFISSLAFAKTDIHLVQQGSIAAGVTQLDTSIVIPVGKIVNLKKFGGLAPALQANTWSYIALQWGNGGGWETIRAGYGAFEYSIRRDFVGDGSKRFRLVRKNNSTTVALDMGAWIEAIVKD